MGLAHDIGKYSEAFQRRLLENGRKVDHATAGAVECARLGAEWAAFCVAGHHGGLRTGAQPWMMRLLHPDGPPERGLSGGIPDYSRLAWEPAAFHAAGPLGPGPVDRLFFRPDALLLPGGRRLPGYGGVPARRAAAPGRA